jgi:hypothetical protein
VQQGVEPVEKLKVLHLVLLYTILNVYRTITYEDQMARYKEYSYEQGKLIQISFSQQIIPGTFEFTLDYIIDKSIESIVK